MVDYISRTLVADQGSGDQRTLDETEIASFLNPLVILGEPGIGKTTLTDNLQRILEGKRVAAGTFSRSENLTPFQVEPPAPLIIDGLDEVSTNAGEPPLDGVLRKLDRLGRPRFVISCRAADWQGLADRWKIEQDYGLRPITLHILPFSIEQARGFLAGYDLRIDPVALLDQITKAGLPELIGNPLTLGLLAEVSLEGKGLPDSKTELLEGASALLLKEKNPAHASSSIANARVDELLLSAGAIAAHLLISGSVGISTTSRDDPPSGFVHVADTVGLPNAPLTKEVIGSRLFRTEGEGLFV
jgi:hypothetical protein